MPAAPHASGKTRQNAGRGSDGHARADDAARHLLPVLVGDDGLDGDLAERLVHLRHSAADGEHIPNEHGPCEFAFHAVEQAVLTGQIYARQRGKQARAQHAVYHAARIAAPLRIGLVHVDGAAVACQFVKQRHFFGRNLQGKVRRQAGRNVCERIAVHRNIPPSVRRAVGRDVKNGTGAVPAPGNGTKGEKAARISPAGG